MKCYKEIQICQSDAKVIYLIEEGLCLICIWLLAHPVSWLLMQTPEQPWIIFQENKHKLRAPREVEHHRVFCPSYPAFNSFTATFN